MEDVTVLRSKVTDLVKATSEVESLYLLCSGQAIWLNGE